MIEALRAAVPRPELADRLALFGRFVGSWDVERTGHAADGTSFTVLGEWHWGWVLDGRAIQDVFICPARSLRTEPVPPPGEWGTVLRFFDPAIDAWRATWISPVTGLVHRFVAREVGDEIVLSGATDDGHPLRWIFSDIAADSFRWRSEESADGGETWRTTVTMRMRRKPVPGGDAPAGS
jgi:hypothetical protein